MKMLAGVALILLGVLSILVGLTFICPLHDPPGPVQHEYPDFKVFGE
jgi:hypothetical protein